MVAVVIPAAILMTQITKTMSNPRQKTWGNHEKKYVMKQ
jgi:hypothetical protein